MKKKLGKRIIMILVLSIVLILAIVVGLCRKESVITMPYDLGNGLIMESIFQFTGVNPDCGNQEGENIGSITVTNTSSKYLDNAEITVTSKKGESFDFLISDLPAGKSAMAFSCENKSFDNEMSFSKATCEATFDDEASMNDDSVEASVNHSQIVLKNCGEQDLQNITVYCHSVLEEQYFGGITYTYTIDKLPANATTELDAMDCMTGLAEVVRVEINEI